MNWLPWAVAAAVGFIVGAVLAWLLAGRRWARELGISRLSARRSKNV